MAYIRVSLGSINYIIYQTLSHVNVLEWDNCINSLAVGIKCMGSHYVSQILNEINYSANGLETLFNLVRYKSEGY
jgi:starch synthase